MPILKLETTVAMTEEKRKPLLAALSKTLALAVGKPEKYVLVTCSPSTILMSGKDGDAAFVDIRSIGGLSDDVNRRLSQHVCHLLKDALGIAPDRVYLNFTNLEAGNWGWNGDTFG